MLLATLVASLGVPAVAPGMPGSHAAVAAARPRVTIVVGPVAEITPRYRAQAEAAAREAEAAGADVVRVYSPDATWEAVRRAATGASIVVYLGHGNGWPSRYRDEPYPVSQNGFGLNPVAGVDDESHQYFGEAHVGSLRLAPNAVVLLHHLCYASGNTEPGLPEGSRADSIARVDNYAAGFLRAGARAVVAEAKVGPALYVRALLRERRTVEQIWAGAPTRNGNTFTEASVRTPGYTLRLDPDRPGSGYYRSLVSQGALPAAAVRAGAQGAVPGPAGTGEPSLRDLGLTFGVPVLRERPVAGAVSRITLPLSAADLDLLPEEVAVGVRWDPIDPDPATNAGPDGGPVPSPSPTPVPSPPATAAPGVAPADPPAAVTPAPVPTATPVSEPPEIALVVAERPGSVVETVRGRRGSRGLVADVRIPEAPGRYRLVPTLHQPDGTGYDAATQALLTPLHVLVSGDVGVAWGTPERLDATAGAEVALAVRVLNTGTTGWDGDVPDARRGGRFAEPRLPARIVATWISSAGLPVPAATSTVLPATAVVPGGTAVLQLAIQAPQAPGAYLLVLDVLSPALGPMSAAGADPAVIRVDATAP